MTNYGISLKSLFKFTLANSLFDYDKIWFVCSSYILYRSYCVISYSNISVNGDFCKIYLMQDILKIVKRQLTTLMPSI